MKKYSFEVYFNFLKSSLIEVEARNNCEAMIKILNGLSESQLEDVTTMRLFMVR